MNLTWSGRQLQSIANGDVTVSYAYNADGQRISKTFLGETTEYFYNGSILAGQKTGNDVIVFMYDNNGDIFGFAYNGTEYYYVKNAQNDVVAITDSNGNVIANYYYNAWGQLIDYTGNESLAILNPIRYRSYYFDNESGLYYLNSRYYSPNICRFLNADGIYDTNTGMLSHNMFAYCNNNSINMSDSTGTGPFWKLLKSGFKKIINIISGKDDESTSDNGYINDMISGTINYGKAIENAKKDYITQVANVINYKSTKDAKIKEFNNKRVKIKPNHYYARRAYQGISEIATSMGYDLKNMTWEDVQSHPKLEKEILNSYCIWDQQTLETIAKVYGVDWFIENGSGVIFK